MIHQYVVVQIHAASALLRFYNTLNSIPLLLEYRICPYLSFAYRYFDKTTQTAIALFHNAESPPMKLIRSLLLVLTIAILNTQTQLVAKPAVKLTVIFDLGGVLIGSDWKKSALILGPHLLASYLIQHRTSPRNLLHKFYHLMRLADPTSGACCVIKDPFWQPATQPDASMAHRKKILSRNTPPSTCHYYPASEAF